jgi:hypothetical protein
MRILDRLEQGGYNVFELRPTLGFKDAPSLAWRALRWSGARDLGDEAISD